MLNFQRQKWKSFSGPLCDAQLHMKFLYRCPKTMLVAICTKVAYGVCACMLTWKSFPGPAVLSSLETLHKNSASLSKFEVHVSWPCSSNMTAFRSRKEEAQKLEWVALSTESCNISVDIQRKPNCVD